MNTIKNFLTQHPVIAGLVRVIEGAIVGALIVGTANGFDFSAVGLKSLGVAIGTAVLVALRNWLIQSPLNPTNTGK